MFDESSGWAETSKNLETHQGIPIVKLQVDFSPKAFNVWHQSLFTNKLELTVENCVKIFKICDYYNDTKILEKIEAFMKTQISKLNPFEVLDLSRNLNDECIERMGNFDGKISEKNVKRIRKMKLASFKVLFNAAATKFKKEEVLKLMTLALVNVEELREHLMDVIENVDFSELELNSKKLIYVLFRFALRSVLSCSVVFRV